MFLLSGYRGRGLGERHMFKKTSVVTFTTLTIALISLMVVKLVDKVSKTSDLVASETATTACIGIGAITLIFITALLVIAYLDEDR
jgi:hypothetical protein